MAQSLVREQKERSALDQRAAKIAANQVALEGRRMARREIEEVAGIQRVVAHKVEHLTMEFIGAGTRRDIHDSARTLPVFRAEGRVIHLELLHTADRRLEIKRIKILAVERDAVDQEVDTLFAVA